MLEHALIARRARAAFSQATSSGERKVGVKRDGTPYAPKMRGKSNLQSVIYPAEIPGHARERNYFYICKTENKGNKVTMMHIIGDFRIKGCDGFYRIIPMGSRDILSDVEDDLIDSLRSTDRTDR